MESTLQWLISRCRVLLYGERIFFGVVPVCKIFLDSHCKTPRQGFFFRIKTGNFFHTMDAIFLLYRGGDCMSEGEVQEPEVLLENYGTTALPAASDAPIHCLTIIGQIEGHMILPQSNKTTKYEHLIPQLVAIEQDEKVKGVLIVLNTAGGDVESGLAIAEAIRGLSKPKVSIVMGGGHSIGVPIAVASDYSFIAPSATMTIHPVRLTGMVIGVPATMEYMERMQDRVVAFVTDNSHIDEQTFRRLMLTVGELSQDIGTVIVGKKAVEYGLIDEVGSIHEAMHKLNALIDEREAACHD